MHKLLRRQVRKTFRSLDEVPARLAPLIEAVDAAYTQADHDRRLLERSLDLASDELLEANRELREHADRLERRVEERTAQLRASNASLEREIAERRIAEAAIRRSEERYRTLFETSRDTIFISRPDGQLIDINPAGVELFGVTSTDELLDVNVRRLYRRPQDRDALVSRVIDEGFVRDAEVELVRRNGDTITVLATISAVRDDTGAVVALRGILRDVTGQRRLEHELLHAQKMEAVGRLAGGVAHDFNNLLTAIIGYSQKIAAYPEHEMVRSWAEAIAAAGDRGAGLTGQLLAFSRRQVVQPTVLDLNAVITRMERLLRRLIPEDVEVETSLDPHLAPVRIDRSLLEQVVLNLAINAGDAMPEGGRLTIRTLQLAGDPGGSDPPREIIDGPCACLCVEDTGIGIPDAIRSQIFEPFFTTKDPARGTGLGLATVYSAVRQSGGRVQVASEVGVGSRFDVFLPTVASLPLDPQVATTGQAPATGSEAVLLVEDDPTVRDLLRCTLEDLGYTVVSADDGLAALETVRGRDHELDLVVTDVVMPRMNGLELARRLRHERPDLRILLMSGYTRDRRRLEEEELLGRHCQFLQKPFTTETLASSIRRLLEQS